MWFFKKKKEETFFDQLSVYSGIKQENDNYVRDLNMPRQLKNINGNVFISGSNSTGKTSILRDFASEALKNNSIIVGFDGKGIKDKNSLYYFMNNKFEKENKKFMIIDLFNSEKSEKYNPLYSKSSSFIKKVISIIVDDNEELNKNISKVKKIVSIMEDLFKKNNVEFTLKNIYIYSNIDNLEILLNANQENLFDNKFLISNTDILNEMEYVIEEFLDETKEIFDGNLSMREILNDKINILFILDEIGKPRISNKLLNIALEDFYTSATTVNIDNNKVCLFDEIDLFNCEKISDILKISKAYNIKSAITYQNISNLDNDDSKQDINSLIENINNYILFRQNTDNNATFWANIIGKKEEIIRNFSWVRDEEEINEKKIIGINTGGATGRMKLDRINTETQEKYIYSPEDFKNLKLGEVIYYLKNSRTKGKTKVF